MGYCVVELHTGVKNGFLWRSCYFILYPAHHITMGEGGAILVNNRRLQAAIDLEIGAVIVIVILVGNTCNKRFDWKLGDLPHGYDHKYIYSHIGFNLVILKLQLV